MARTDLRHRYSGVKNYPFNLSGLTFGRLTVSDRQGSNSKGTIWNCLCVCGSARVVSRKHLVSGGTKSCGCLAIENTVKRSTTHGKSRGKSRAYSAWQAMKRRCLYKKEIGWHNYGGRGISVCPEWVASFEAFYEHMGESPDGLSLDRIDVNGNYEPGNCRWATDREQMNNIRPNVVLEIEGKRFTMKQAAEQLGTPYQRVKQRRGRKLPPHRWFDPPLNPQSVVLLTPL